ncbi:MAG: hypothetical protein J6I79_05405 [Paludibacteraceae bacterium]|nr:hypothetical protein [Paludibacteraceae bacterium]
MKFKLLKQRATDRLLLFALDLILALTRLLLKRSEDRYLGVADNDRTTQQNASL